MPNEMNDGVMMESYVEAFNVVWSGMIGLSAVRSLTNLATGGGGGLKLDGRLQSDYPLQC